MVGENQDIFQIIGGETTRLNVPCVLVGGFALTAHRVSRQTFDIDLMILHTDFPKLLESLSKLGYRLVRENDAFARLVANRFPLMDIDFLFVDPLTLEGILKTGIKATVAGREFVVPSLLHLIALKLHAIKQDPVSRHDKDMADILNLVRTNQMDAARPDFRETAVKYGSLALYEEIQKKASEWKN